MKRITGTVTVERLFGDSLDNIIEELEQCDEKVIYDIRIGAQGTVRT